MAEALVKEGNIPEEKARKIAEKAKFEYEKNQAVKEPYKNEIKKIKDRKMERNKRYVTKFRV